MLRRRAGQLLAVAGVGVLVVGLLVVAYKFAGIALLSMNVLVHTAVIRKRDGWLNEGEDGECGNCHRDYGKHLIAAGAPHGRADKLAGHAGHSLVLCLAVLPHNNPAFGSGHTVAVIFPTISVRAMHPTAAERESTDVSRWSPITK